MVLAVLVGVIIVIVVVRRMLCAIVGDLSPEAAVPAMV